MDFHYYTGEEIRLLSECTLCPRECGVNRFGGGTGYCKSDAGMNVASICIHRGEEPAISGPEGICNIFFSGCNLRCIYCQNYEISNPCRRIRIKSPGYDEVLDRIAALLKGGVKAVGFVSPSHVIPQVKAIIRGLHAKGYRPVTVFNTNGYDRKSTISSLEGLIDVYLPDLKYIDPNSAEEFSGAPDYPETAMNAIREMYFQKGSVLITDSEGRAENGLIVRHLVLPGHADDSMELLERLARDVSRGIHISLMSQYHPVPAVRHHPDLGRSLYASEYSAVAKYAGELGFRNGWFQGLESHGNYRPDFSREHPFE
ncbi:MAG TPA: radical SAM protein [Bacteroidales bacterium]|jgi:putative pyruvate formate lyase activating enzyme|nr:radical SAM protein [Bacteroidales bacterium]HNR41203.1 radical SAM protein [Bacteroidales bacterium]HPM19035.1 radical SAM protein [Bacteroidales bacterium]HQG77183.1 radical SAM protein [Bacteroidales bacterium]